MIRSAAAVVLALTCSPAVLSAQDMVFTVTAASADVYKGPTTVTPVIGRAARGTALPVSRNLGSWAKVEWPDAPDGVGYVHMTMGRLAGTRAAASAEPAPARASADPGPATTTMLSPAPRRLPRDQMAVSDQPASTAISHVFGIGGRFGSTRSFGATARAWRNNRLALQFALTRDSMTSDVAEGRVTSMQLESGAVYALFDHMGESIWITPYVGSALTFHRQTLKVSSPDAAANMTDNGFGFRAFGGTEVTFASVQRFGLSVEFGYRQVPAPFAGFEPDKLSVSIAGHWYVR